jgi:hypothetical protein
MTNQLESVPLGWNRHAALHWDVGIWHCLWLSCTGIIWKVALNMHQTCMIAWRPRFLIIHYERVWHAVSRTCRLSDCIGMLTMGNRDLWEFTSLFATDLYTSSNPVHSLFCNLQGWAICKAAYTHAVLDGVKVKWYQRLFLILIKTYVLIVYPGMIQVSVLAYCHRVLP